MRAFEFLFEKKQAAQDDAGSTGVGEPGTDPLYSLKLAIAHKIKDLPPSDETKNSLQEVEDIIDSMKLGGRKKAAVSSFDTWTDADVKSAKDLLAKYVVGLEAPIEYKRSMLEQWKNGGLIDVDLLLSGRHEINDIVKGYGNNLAIAEMANDLMQVSGVGKGKGEFMLKVLSPKITTPSNNKGDIEVIGFGTVEVKTTDGGAGRFTDRQVKPGSGYQAAVSDFFKTFDPFLQEPEQIAEPAEEQPAVADTSRMQQLAGVKTPNTKTPAATPSAPVAAAVPPVAEAKKDTVKKTKKLYSKTGINIDQLSELYKKLPSENKNDFSTKLTNVLDQVFVKAPKYVGAIVTAITAGSTTQAKQLYGVGVLNNYMAHKEDKGILYIDLTASVPTFTFFTDNDSLNAAGMRLNIETAYPVSNGMQEIYPQTSIVGTKQSQPLIQ